MCYYDYRLYKCVLAYNTIERCWACLENFWNGTILDSVEKTLEWAKNMIWKGIKPIVKILEKTYETGIKPSQEELDESRELWHPSPTLLALDVDNNIYRLTGTLFSCISLIFGLCCR
ncbi:ISAzo13-like element transposase-related protein [Geminocystis sp. CENA526]|uniref:ISAzo13-like element transposase-related protein n=1 Tax=Geminocystis sp. CENA526 TaxID=1355871 RepID=UPI003D6DD8C9